MISYHMNLKQPLAGILASALVILVSLGFVSLFPFPLFSGWVSYALLCLIPMQIVVGVIWRTKHPEFAARLGQPGQGLALLLVTVAVGAVVGTAQYYGAGRGLGPTPMLMHCTIVSVVITFWLSIMWGGWPFTAWIKEPVAAGLVLLVACYLINYLLFRIFFNYAFMQGAPVYEPSLDPHGMFGAWHAVAFYLAVLSVMFLMLSFDLWPLTRFPAIMKQPTLGIVWTLVCLVVGGGVFGIVVNLMGMDPVAFMVRVPVPFIFGTIVVLNMLQGSMFAKFNQPLKGVLNAAAVAIIGSLLARMYVALMPSVTGALQSGPPAYEQEIWLASSLLGVTFPFLIFHAEFFKLWPLRNEIR
jgi:hypothetical protein